MNLVKLLKKEAAAFLRRLLLAKGIEKRGRKEVLYERALTASGAFHVYTVPPDFERAMTKIKTICDIFVNT